MRERDKFLTEAMGECWHEGLKDCWSAPDEYTKNIEDTCVKCDQEIVYEPCIHLLPNNFSSWEGFGKLWEWVQKQEWFPKLIQRTYTGNDWIENIHPDRFADSLYVFLKKDKEEENLMLFKES